jgi:retron-type reverse transcriptase
MLTDVNRIATLAKEDAARRFYSIAHLINEERLTVGFWKLTKDSSAGIDGVVHAKYAANVEENIRQLHGRLVEGKYQAQPLRRVYIPKENSKKSCS